MGFLDKLLGRKQTDSDAQTTPPPASTPEEQDDHSHDEGEAHDHSHDEGGHQH
jgi:hypothetical protein